MSHGLCGRTTHNTHPHPRYTPQLNTIMKVTHTCAALRRVSFLGLSAICVTRPVRPNHSQHTSSPQIHTSIEHNHEGHTHLCCAEKSVILGVESNLCHTASVTKEVLDPCCSLQIQTTPKISNTPPPPPIPEMCKTHPHRRSPHCPTCAALRSVSFLGFSAICVTRPVWPKKYWMNRCDLPPTPSSRYRRACFSAAVLPCSCSCTHNTVPE